jgi:S1-C subfamily serine protease
MSEGMVRRGYLGLAGRQRPLDRRLARAHALTQPSGVEVMTIERGGPASHAGLRDGDIIVSIDGEAVTTVDDLHGALTRWTAGREVVLAVLRRVERVEVRVLPRAG